MKYYIVDAFADHLFAGNQAGICLLDSWIDEKLMQNIAKENNLAETAFLVKNNHHYDLRWFTPEGEIDLCGHATLASAYIIMNFVDKSIEVVEFQTMSGILTVNKNGDLFEMDFPSRPPKKVDVLPIMERAIGAKVSEAYLSRDMMLVVDNEQIVKGLNPDMSKIAQIPDCFAVIVTAKGESVDFVSRFFISNASVFEDPVTGSSHSTLIPFWAEQLGKQSLVAKQLSERGGTLYCENCGDRVKISGKAKLYLEGEIKI